MGRSLTVVVTAIRILHRNVIIYLMRKHTLRRIYTVAVTTIWVFAVKRKLAIHQRTNTGEEPYNYCHCNKAFGDIQAVLSLAKHRKRQMKMRIPKMFF